MRDAYKVLCTLLTAACASCAGEAPVEIRVNTATDPVEISWSGGAMHEIDVFGCAAKTCEDITGEITGIWTLSQIWPQGEPVPAPKIVSPIQYGVIPDGVWARSELLRGLTSGTTYIFKVTRDERCGETRCKVEAGADTTVTMP